MSNLPRATQTEGTESGLNLCQRAYILLQTVDGGGDLRGSRLPVVLRQSPGQVLLQLITQLEGGEGRWVSRAPLLVPRPAPTVSTPAKSTTLGTLKGTMRWFPKQCNGTLGAQPTEL